MSLRWVLMCWVLVIVWELVSLISVLSKPWPEATITVIGFGLHLVVASVLTLLLRGSYRP